jgi:hypothetical protein
MELSAGGRWLAWVFVCCSGWDSRAASLAAAELPLLL